MATPAPRILIVEDDSSIATGLAMNLRFEGHEVVVAADGESGLRTAQDWHPDLVVLDVMLPGMNGYEVCHAIRRVDQDTAIVILSARGREEDKVLGLEVGADDYVTKPFGLKELLARIAAVLRRRKSRAETIGFHDVLFNPRSRVVTKNGEPVELTTREVALLEHLLTHPGQLFTRQQLLDAAWGLDYDGGERTVDNFLRRLRVKLEEDPAEPRHFVTVVGAGYRFVP